MTSTTARLLFPVSSFQRTTRTFPTTLRRLASNRCVCKYLVRVLGHHLVIRVGDIGALHHERLIAEGSHVFFPQGKAALRLLPAAACCCCVLTRRSAAAVRRANLACEGEDSRLERRACVGFRGRATTKLVTRTRLWIVWRRWQGVNRRVSASRVQAKPRPPVGIYQ